MNKKSLVSFPKASLRKIRKRNTRATSLIEVLVVMAILIIGIFSVIRLFPYGLNYLKSAGSRTNATHLANNFLAEVQTDAANLPDAVLPVWYDTATGQRQRIVGIDPDDLKKISEPIDGVTFADINKSRYISNEPISIAPGMGSSVYLLKYGPMLLPSTQGDAPPTTANQMLYDQYLQVKSTPFSLSEISPATMDPNLLSEKVSLMEENTCLVEYNTGTDGLAMGVNVYFKSSASAPRFEIRYERQFGNVTTSVLIPSSPAASNAVDTTFASSGLRHLMINDTNIVPGSLVVTRLFDRIANGANWTAGDAYQYKLVTGNTSPTVNYGRLMFHPEASTLSQKGPQGQKAFKALVSYPVYDWHILHEDKEVPTVTPGIANEVPIRLALPELKRRGETERDNTSYEGISPTLGDDILVFAIDPLNGTLNPLVSSRYNSGSPSITTSDYWVEYRGKESSYRTGVIYINTAKVKPGTKLRVYYRATGDWGVSLHKAAAEYFPTTFPIATTLNEVGLTVTGNATPFFSASGTRIYFDRSDYNKTFTATLEINGIRQTAKNFTVDNVGSGTEKNYSYADLSKIVGTNPWRVIGTIKGTSAKARVIWKDDNVGTGAVEKWQKQDMDVYLTQE